LTPEQIEPLRKSCLSMLRRRASLSAAASAVPVPGIDALTDIALMVEILPKISDRFGLSHRQIQTLDPTTLTLVLKSIRSLGPSLVGKVITKSVIVSVAKAVGIRVTAKQAAKYVPVIGTVGAAVLGYTAFMYVGKRHIEQCVAVRRAMVTLAGESEWSNSSFSGQAEARR